MAYRKAKAVVMNELYPTMSAQDVADATGISKSTVLALRRLGEQASQGQAMLIEKLRKEEIQKAHKMLHLSLDRLTDDDLIENASIRDTVQVARLGWELTRAIDGKPSSYVGIDDESLDRAIERLKKEVTGATIIELKPEDIEEAQVEYGDEEIDEDPDEDDDTGD